MSNLLLSRSLTFLVSFLLLGVATANAAPPSVSLTPPVSPTVPSGFTVNTSGSAGDFDGVVEKVEIFANGGLVGEATLEPTGVFFLEWNPVVTGIYTIEAKATDNEGETASSAPIFLTVVSGTAPVVAIDPLPAQIPLGEAPLITGTSGDADGTVQAVNIYINGLPIGGATVEADGDFTFNGWTPTVEGSYGIVARAIDDLNFFGTSSPRTVEVVDGVRAAKVVFDPIVPQMVGVGDSVPLSGSAVDPAGDIEEVEIFVNGSNEGLADVSSDGRFRFEWEADGLGEFTLVARASSVAGQVASTDPLLIEVASGFSPDATLTVPPPGSIAVGSVSSLIGSASDPDSNLQSVEVFVNGGFVGNVAELLPSGAFGFGWVPTAVGEAVVQVRVQDESGLQGLSDPISVTIVEGLPPVVALSPPPVTDFAVGSTLKWVGSAGDQDGSVSRVEIFANDTLLGLATLSADGVFEFDWTVTAPGTFNVRARAVDDRGLSTLSNAFPVLVGANAPPSIEFEAPPTPVTTGSNLRLTATAEDFDGSVAEVSFFANGSLVATALPPERGNPFTVSWIPQSAGTFSLVAVAMDNRGATTSSAPRTVSVKAPVGARPIITPSSLPGSTFGRYFLGSSVVLTADASDSDGSVVEVTFVVNGETIGTFSEPPYAADFIFDAAGDYLFTALARDDSGNVSATTVLLEALDGNRAIPAARITSPSVATAVAVGETVSATAEGDGFGNEIDGMELVFGGTIKETSSSSPIQASLTSDIAVEADLRALAYYTSEVTVTRIVDGEEVESQVSYTASGISAPVRLRFVPPVFSAGFGTVVPIQGWMFSSATFGKLIFPDGDLNSPWTFAYDIDSWLGATGDGRVWSFDYGYVSESPFRQQTFSSQLFGNLRWRDRQPDDATIFLDSEVYGALGKPLGAPFFYSFVLLDWLGVSDGSGVYSARWEWVSPVQRFVIESSAVGRLFLQPLQPGTVFSVRQGRFLE